MKQQRVKTGLTQEELSLQLGVTCRTLQNYESGAVYPKKRELYTRLAELFNTDVNYWLIESQESTGTEKSVRREDVQGLISKVSNLFSDDDLTEEDLDDFMRTIQGAYWAAKDKNKHLSR